MKKPKCSAVSDTKFWCDLRRVEQSPEKILTTILDRLAKCEKEPAPQVSESARAVAPRRKRNKPSKEWNKRSMQLEYSALDLLDEINERASQQDNDKVSLYLVAHRGMNHLWNRARENDQASANLLASMAIELCEHLEELARMNPEILREMAMRNPSWPALIGTHPGRQKACKRLLATLKVGKTSGVKLEKAAKAKIFWSDRTPANFLALSLLHCVRSIRQYAGCFSGIKEFFTSPLSKRIMRLEDFSSATWKEWEKVSWDFLLALTDRKPDTYEALRGLAKKKNDDPPDSVTRERIRERICESFKIIAGD